MKLMDLPNWPPQPASEFDSEQTSPGPDLATLDDVKRVEAESVTFTADCEGRHHTYVFQAPNPKAAENVANLLHANRGTTLVQLGFLEVA